MSEQEEQQNEEREALQSIYEGDENFKEINPTTYQYKYGKDDDYKSFLVELLWTKDYPTDVPEINMETFFNRNLLPAVKDKITAALNEEAQQWVGCGMTYTLFECLKDRIEELVADQQDKPLPIVDLESNVKAITISDANADSSKLPKKEQLTKAQKRRQWERSDHKGEKPRGYNWVDLVKHLSQTGGGKSDNAPSSVVDSSNSSIPVINNY